MLDIERHIVRAANLTGVNIGLAAIVKLSIPTSNDDGRQCSHSGGADATDGSANQDLPKCPTYPTSAKMSLSDKLSDRGADLHNQTAN